MPPNAIGPLTSNCPPTISPGLSDALKLYGFPQCGQKPSSRFTFCSQWGQNRLAAGTSGRSMTSLSGSVLGSGGSDIRPPTRRERVVTVVRADRLPRRVPEAPRVAAEVPTVAEAPAPSSLSRLCPIGGLPQSSQAPSTILPEQP